MSESTGPIAIRLISDTDVLKEILAKHNPPFNVKEAALERFEKLIKNPSDASLAQQTSDILSAIAPQEGADGHIMFEGTKISVYFTIPLSEVSKTSLLKEIITRAGRIPTRVKDEVLERYASLLRAQADQ